MQQRAADTMSNLQQRGVLDSFGKPTSNVFQQNFGPLGMHQLQQQQMLADGVDPLLIPQFQQPSPTNGQIFGGAGAKNGYAGMGNKGAGPMPAAAQPGHGPGVPDRGAPATPSQGIFGLNSDGTMSLPEHVRRSRGGRRQERQLNQDIKKSLRPRNMRQNPNSVVKLPFA
jgi:hypothetical protein